MTSEPAHHIELTDKPAAEDHARVVKHLVEFNERKVGEPQGPGSIAALIRDPSGRTVGGLWASVRWRWLTLDTLFVPEALRGQGYGDRLIGEVEAEGRRRGCLGACTDTYAFQAPDFYKRHGYTVVGVMEDYPPGHRRFFLSKTFDHAGVLPT